MRQGQQHHYFYVAVDAEVIEVLQDCAEVANGCDEIYTEGLGPCIGVAFAWQDKGYMFHGAGIHHTNEFEAFLDQVNGSLAASERSKIRPVVAGGNVTGGVGGDVLLSRQHCLTKLRERGFGTPHERWCPNDSAQALHLDVHNNTVRVCTETMDIFRSGKATWVDIVNT